LRHRHQDSVIAGRVFGERRHQFRRHQVRVAGLGQAMPQALEEFLGRGWLEHQAHPDAAAEGQEFWRAKFLGQSRVSTQDDGQQTAGVEVGRAEQAPRSPAGRR
jgi:hypothetical protein